MFEARRFRSTNLALASVLAWTLASLPATGAAAESRSTNPKIVERSIVFHGGDAQKRSRVALSICSKSGCFDLSVQNDGQRFDYEVEAQSGEQKRRVRWTNDSLTETLDGQAKELDATTRQRAQDFVSARVYFPFLPFRLADPAAQHKDLGLERWGDRDLHKVKVTFAAGSSTDAGDEFLYWFDPKSARLEQFAYRFGEGERRGLRFRRGQNYRTVGGILFFDAENFAIDAPGLEVEQITPSFVAEKMKLLSVVELKNIEVTAAR